MRGGLLTCLLPALLTLKATAQPAPGLPPAASASRFFTTTGGSLAFPVSMLRQVTQWGRGTTVNLEYRINSRLSVAGAWDANILPVQSSRLAADLDPTLKRSISQLKGEYQTNALGVYGIWYGEQRALRPYLTGGLGLISITVPRLLYEPNSQLVSLGSTTRLSIFGAGGVGLNWQFSTPVAAFGEASVYVVPASSPVVSGANNYVTLKAGLRFPLF